MKIFLFCFRVGNNLHHGNDAWVVKVEDARIDGSLA